MGQALLRISLKVLAGMLLMPDDCKVLAVQQERDFGDTLLLLLDAAEFPPVAEEFYPSEITPRYSVQIHPDDPSYRKVECAGIEVQRGRYQVHVDTLEVFTQHE